jgi:hypothetical protein
LEGSCDILLPQNICRQLPLDSFSFALVVKSQDMRQKKAKCDQSTASAAVTAKPVEDQPAASPAELQGKTSPNKPKDLDDAVKPVEPVPDSDGEIATPNAKTKTKMPESTQHAPCLHSRGPTPNCKI